MKCLKGLFESHDSRSRHTVPPAHFSREDSQAQPLPSAFCVQRQRWETRQTLPSWSCLWVGSTHMINETITNKWLVFVMWSLWWRENTETYDGVSDLVGKVCGGILEEILFELRSKDILVKIGKRSFGKTWKWEQFPFSMISGLSLIMVNPVNRLQMPSGAHWLYLDVIETPR